VRLEELNARYAIQGLALFERGEGGLPRLRISCEGAEAHLYLHGAHVTHFQPASEKPVLWLSRRSWFSDAKPIRGGIPVCFPWFGASSENPALPTHGFARILAWDVASVRRFAFEGSAQDTGIEVVMRLAADERTKRFWPHAFAARLGIVVTAQLLKVRLQVTNAGAEPFQFAEALHSYFAVADVRTIAVQGLQNGPYLDTAGGAQVEKVDGPEPIRLAGETDRIYRGATAACTIEDPGLGRRISIEKTGSSTTVVWNPWIEKARRMEDFGDDEWTGMVCVETANAYEHAVVLKPGAVHAMEARICTVR